MNAPLRRMWSEAAASVADLGTIIPIGVALVAVNGVDPIAAFAVAGVVMIATGALYRLPIAVQPIKAAAAIAIATRAAPGVIAGAGVVLAAILLLLGLVRAWPLVVRLFPKVIIRGGQLGVGILLARAGVDLVRGADGRIRMADVAIVAALAVLAGWRGVPGAFMIVAGGCAFTIVLHGLPGNLQPAPGFPSVSLPTLRDLVVALPMLVIPQLPLTLGNAIVGTADLANDYFGARAERVSPARLGSSIAIANLAAGFTGGMPLCHGSSGLTALHRAGARTGLAPAICGVFLAIAAVVFGSAAPALFALIPVPVLAALLTTTGARHAMLVADLRGRALWIAIAMGAVGGITRNLALGLAVGLGASAAGRLLRARTAAAGEIPAAAVAVRAVEARSW